MGLCFTICRKTTAGGGGGGGGGGDGRGGGAGGIGVSVLGMVGVASDADCGVDEEGGFWEGGGGGAGFAPVSFMPPSIPNNLLRSDSDGAPVFGGGGGC